MLTDCMVLRDPSTKCSRGFEFVTCADMEEVGVAKKARPRKVDRRPVEPKRATSRDDNSKARCSLNCEKDFCWWH